MSVLYPFFLNKRESVYMFVEQPPQQKGYVPQLTMAVSKRHQANLTMTCQGGDSQPTCDKLPTPLIDYPSKTTRKPDDP